MKVLRMGAALLLKFCLLVSLAAFSCAAQSGGESGDPDALLPQRPVSATATQNESAPYEPITHQQRFQWFIERSFGPEHIAGALFLAAYETGRDNPPEYHGTWAGFGDRFASREAALTIRNGMEAGLGEFSGEDPRYFRNADLPLKRRIGNVVKQTFLARHRDGSYDLAFARYTAYAGSNFISNAWRPESQADTQHALSRTGWAFVGRMAGNAWDEFWPDMKQHIFHRNN